MSNLQNKQKTLLDIRRLLPNMVEYIGQHVQQKLLCKQMRFLLFHIKGEKWIKFYHKFPQTSFYNLHYRGSEADQQRERMAICFLSLFLSNLLDVIVMFNGFGLDNLSYLVWNCLASLVRIGSATDNAEVEDLIMVVIMISEIIISSQSICWKNQTYHANTHYDTLGR